MQVKNAKKVENAYIWHPSHEWVYVIQVPCLKLYVGKKYSNWEQAFLNKKKKRCLSGGDSSSPQANHFLTLAGIVKILGYTVNQASH